MKIQPVTSIKITIAAFIILLTALTSLSLTHAITSTTEMYSSMALENTRALFSEIITAREWNARNDGVYIAVSDSVRPNPYLKDPFKNIISNFGVKLTKVNPAYMTRMISELMSKKQGARLHITSLKPINPGNNPSQWERDSLEKFERGAEETYSFFSNGSEMFRYMAPLKTEKECLTCHVEAGYRVGDIRGGISVEIPFGSYRSMITRAHASAVARHALIWIPSVALILLLGFMLVGSVKKELAALSEVNTLKGFIPICSNCKKIRNDAGYWERLEKYIEEHTDAQMSHGLCPECSEKLYGDQEWYRKSKVIKE